MLHSLNISTFSLFWVQIISTYLHLIVILSFPFLWLYELQIYEAQSGELFLCWGFISYRKQLVAGGAFNRPALNLSWHPLVTSPAKSTMLTPSPFFVGGGSGSMDPILIVGSISMSISHPHQEPKKSSLGSSTSMGESSIV